jgi:glutamate-5-semialdehyde dehydrogenase
LGPLVNSTPLNTLEAGMRIIVGGDRVVSVPAAIAERFRPGDSLVYSDATDELLLIPVAQKRAAADAVTQALAAFEQMRAVSDRMLGEFYSSFARRLGSDAVWSVVLEANQVDVEDARRRERSTTRLVASDRLRQGMIEGLLGWGAMPSARGRVLETIEHSGWAVDLVSAELGVVAFVFEGRPNVLADATGVLKGGNTVVFRIGRDALRTATSIMKNALEPALLEAGLPAGAVRLIESTEHAAGWALFGDRRVSLAVARGSGRAVAALGSLARQAGVPVSLHGTGGAWVVATRETAVPDLERAVTLSLDRKVCNTLNVCCIPRAQAEWLVPAFLRGLAKAGERRQQAFKLHVVEGDDSLWTRELFSRRVPVARAEGIRDEPQAESLPEKELGREWEWEETPEVTLKLVDDMEHAVRLFNAYSPQFVASLISSDPAEHRRFFEAVNAPFVGDGHTRWVDGQLALRRPELGLSNWEYGRLLARGGVLSGDGIYTVRTRARKL